MLSLMVACEDPHLYLWGSGRASPETAVSGSCQQALLGICISVWVWCLRVGWIPQVGQSLDGLSFREDGSFIASLCMPHAHRGKPCFLNVEQHVKNISTCMAPTWLGSNTNVRTCTEIWDLCAAVSALTASLALTALIYPVTVNLYPVAARSMHLYHVPASGSLLSWSCTSFLASVSTNQAASSCTLGLFLKRLRMSSFLLSLHCLGKQPRALHAIGKHSTHELHPRPEHILFV